MNTAPALRNAAFHRGPWPRIAAVALAIYVVYACAQLDASWDRVLAGLGNAATFCASLPANFSRSDLLIKGLISHLQRSLAQRDVVGLRAGEILHGRAE